MVQGGSDNSRIARGIPPQLQKDNIHPRCDEEPDQLSGFEGHKYLRMHVDTR